MTALPALISAQELAKILEQEDTVLLDATYGNAAGGWIPGRTVFDIDDVADLGAVLPHTLPDPAYFEAWATRLGIDSDRHVVVYDCGGIAMAAARAWWMFRVFGHDRVQVLDGGLPEWKRAGLKVDSVYHGRGGPAPAPVRLKPRGRAFTAKFRPELFKRRQEMVDNLETKTFTVVDARDAARYSGDAPEPRPGMEAGHIPGSLNIPYATLIDAGTGRLRQPNELRAALSAIGAEKPVAVSCGSGVTACVVALALHRLGRPDAAIYGGSWAEWGGDLRLPKTKGAAP